MKGETVSVLLSYILCLQLAKGLAQSRTSYVPLLVYLILRALLASPAAGRWDGHWGHRNKGANNLCFWGISMLSLCIAISERSTQEQYPIMGEATKSWNSPIGINSQEDWFYCPNMHIILGICVDFVCFIRASKTYSFRMSLQPPISQELKGLVQQNNSKGKMEQNREQESLYFGF